MFESVKLEVGSQKGEVKSRKSEVDSQKLIVESVKKNFIVLNTLHLCIFPPL